MSCIQYLTSSKIGHHKRGCQVHRTKVQNTTNDVKNSIKRLRQTSSMKSTFCTTRRKLILQNLTHKNNLVMSIIARSTTVTLLRARGRVRKGLVPKSLGKRSHLWDRLLHETNLGLLKSIHRAVSSLDGLILLF